MKYYKVLKKAGNIFRLSLLVLAFIALLTLCAWPFSHQLVDKFDERIIKNYESNISNQFNEANELEKTSPIESIAAYERFLNNISSIKAGDRFYSLKRQSFRKIIAVLKDNEQYETALFWADKWTEYYEKDLLAQGERGLILYRLPNRKDEGKRLLTEWHRRFPEAKFITDAYGSILVQEGQLTQAFLVYARNHLQGMQTAQLDWAVFWDSGLGFSAQNSKSYQAEISTGEMIKLKLVIPTALIRRLRIDMPPSIPLSLTDPIIKIFNKSKLSKTIQLWNIPQTMNQIVQKENIFQANAGNDPYFFWTIPDNLRKSGNTFEFQALLKYYPSKPLIELTSSENANLIEKELLALGEHDALRLFRDIVQTNQPVKSKEKSQQDYKALTTTLKFMEFFWKNSSQKFSQDRKGRATLNWKKIEEKWHFKFKYSIKTNFTQIRFDFPDILGAEFLFSRIMLIEGKTEKEIHLSKDIIEQSHNIKIIDKIFRIIGKDPYFVIDLTNNKNQMTQLIATGVLR